VDHLGKLTFNPGRKIGFDIVNLGELGEGRDKLGAAAAFDDFFVGWPWASSSQCRTGHSYGELRVGCSKKELAMFTSDWIR
jgi:hypothetical protein